MYIPSPVVYYIYRLFNIFFGVVVLLNAVLLCVNVPTEWGDYKSRNLILVRSMYIPMYCMYVLYIYNV